MALSKGTDIYERILEGIDPDYLRSLYRMACYSFGETWNATASSSTGIRGLGDWEDFPDIVVRQLEVGASRRIITHQFISLTRGMYAMPRPEFPQVGDAVAKEVRKQFFLRRWQGDCYEDGHWETETSSAYTDSDGLGVGFVQIGVQTNRRTDKQFVTIRHVPAWQVVYDRFARHPSKARWICFKHYLPVSTAVKMYGEEARKLATNMVDNFTSRHFQVVKLYEYFDVGIDGAEPTRALFLGEVSNKPFKVEASPFGFLPVASRVHFIAPGMRRPIGRIALQMASQELLNRIERRMMATIAKGVVDIVDSTAVDAEDLKAHEAGRIGITIKRIGTGSPGVPVYERIPAQEVSNTLLMLRDMFERQLTSESGVTDADQGRLNPTQRTATENELLDVRSRVHGSWAKRQTVLFYRELVDKVLKVAETYDRDPIELDVFGVNIEINKPGVTASYINEFLTEPSIVAIDEDSLDYRDVKAERAERMSLVLQLEADVQRGVINPMKLAEEKLRAIGETNPQDWLAPVPNPSIASPGVQDSLPVPSG